MCQAPCQTLEGTDKERKLLQTGNRASERLTEQGQGPGSQD